MYYHPLIGIFIFILAILVSFFLGRKMIKTKITKEEEEKSTFIKKAEKNKTSSLPRGEITSPDAPWLKNEKYQE